MIASGFDILPPCFLWDVIACIKSFDLNIHLKLQKTAETFKSFENKNGQKAILTGCQISWGRGWLHTLRPPGLSLTLV